MFSYREFADGAHAYRKRIARQADPYADEDYEYRRGVNEAAILTLTRNTDPMRLVTIFTHLATTLDEIRENSTVVPSHETCMRISALLTYHKLIAQKVGIVDGILESLYKFRFNFRQSTGGLIYELYPTELDAVPPVSSRLPGARAKVPITSSAAKVRTIVHEAFVGMVALNPLRQSMPTFAYVHAFWNCGNFIENARQSQQAGICDTPGSRPVMIYEGIPHATSAYDSMSKRQVSLNEVLLNLLQIVGAMEMAHGYADYTHYDLHSGNVLLQPLETAVDLWYLDYSVRTHYRVVIIDNGLAYCKYEKPESLRMIRKAPQFANAEGTELFMPSSRSDDESVAAAEHLRASRIVNYGSTQNQALGVSRHRSYPLGDVFRIFFDFYSLCNAEVKEQLQPLVSHFFKDLELPKTCTEDQTSSMFNGFALPPFREQMYEYRYADFSKAILATFAERLEPNILLRSVPKPVRWFLYPAPELSDIFDWQRPLASAEIGLYDLGILASLSDYKARSVLESSERREQILASRDTHLRDLAEDFMLLKRAIIRQAKFDKLVVVPAELTIEVILRWPFMRPYTQNVEQCLLIVRGTRGMYSRMSLTIAALDLLGEDGRALVQHSLNTTAETLEEFCRSVKLTKTIREAVSRLRDLTTRIEVVINATRAPKPLPSNWQTINWYRACLPAVNNYLHFLETWGDEHADFGELALP